MNCELNKPLCKRTASLQKGPFVKKNCPLSEKPECPLARPQCPLLPKVENDCPLSKLVGSKNEQKCPLAESGCPCNPNPPCPLAYDDEKVDVSQKSKIDKNPKEIGYPAFAHKAESIGQNSIKIKPSPCPCRVKDSGKKIITDSNYIKSNKIDLQTNNLKANDPKTSDQKASLSKIKDACKVKETNLNVPDCTLSSARPLPCSKCLGELLTEPKTVDGKIYPEDCPYTKIVNMCHDKCLCEDVPNVDSGPPCPFAPKPCPCCATARCPLTRVPDCPLLFRMPKCKTEPPCCQCYCPPIVPPSCDSGIPPLCKMHKIKPIAPKPVACPPVHKPTISIPDSDTPSIIVPHDVLKTIGNTLSELRELCTCDNPPPSQKVNMIPTADSSMPPPPVCDTPKDSIECALECPCEPTRTFHVPTCPIKKPVGLQSFPPSKNKGEVVCPFAPRCCPLGPICPYPVATVRQGSEKEEKYGIQNQVKEKTRNGRKYPTSYDNLSKETQKGSSPFSKDEIKQEINIDLSSNCPLNKLPGDKKKPCPFAPNPCPLDPIKPLKLEQPKVCPFAPEPVCPLMPKPLCPPKPKCLMLPDPPMPECPYAPKSCPLAPKKLCPPDTSLNYDCPCPKPKPCCCCPCPPGPSCADPPKCSCSPPGPCCCTEPPKCPCSPPKPCCCTESPTCPPPKSSCCPGPPKSCSCADPPKSCCCTDPPKSCSCADPSESCCCTDPPKSCSCADPPKCPCPPPDPCCFSDPTSCPTPKSCCCSKEPIKCTTPPPEPRNHPSPTCGCPSSVSCPCTEPLAKLSLPCSCCFKCLSRCCCQEQTSKCLCSPQPPTTLFTKISSPESLDKCTCPEPTCCSCSDNKPECPLVPKPNFTLSTSLNSTNKIDKKNNLMGCPTECPTRDTVNCCPLKNKELPNENSATSNLNPLIKDNLSTIIERLKKQKNCVDCAVELPPCEKFPDGRCPMDKLNLCDCDYPVPPCMAPPQCEKAKAPPQYCVKKNCCMGLPLPPTHQDRTVVDSDQPTTYYEYVPTKPDREETKHYVRTCDKPPNEFPFGLPKERENPNWSIIQGDKGSQKCKTICDQLKLRKPSMNQFSQFNPKDNPMDPETKLVMENRENRARFNKANT